MSLKSESDFRVAQWMGLYTYTEVIQCTGRLYPLHLKSAKQRTVQSRVYYMVIPEYNEAQGLMAHRTPLESVEIKPENYLQNLVKITEIKTVHKFTKI